jgi:hypothetical protein
MLEQFGAPVLTKSPSKTPSIAIEFINCLGRLRHTRLMKMVTLYINPQDILRAAASTGKVRKSMWVSDSWGMRRMMVTRTAIHKR